ncbi:MAG: hypothetical protein ABSF62_10720 [Bryobacteraceae bacterium]|jgi:hypothetical protein
MKSETPNEFFARKISEIQQRDPRSVVHGLLIKEVMVSNGILAHLVTPPNSDTRAEIQLFGSAYYGNQIKSGRIIFQEEDISDYRPAFDAATGEVLFRARASQIAAYIACLRPNKPMLLLYTESPSVDEVSASILTNDQV